MGPLEILAIAFAAAFLFTLIVPTLRRVWVFHLLLAKYLIYWFGDITRVRPVILRLLGKRYIRLTRPRAMRLFCEDMGVTFVKFGQLIASSSGLFPQRYVEEFQKVLDKVRPFSFDVVEQTLEEELGETAQRLKNIEAKPLASASVAQVHAAELEDGTKVVLKIQRPGIKRIIHVDMKIMGAMAYVLQHLFERARLNNVIGIVHDLKATLNEETDFRKEADNLEEFNQIMREHGHQRVHAPVPHRELVTERVLVMERFFGTRVDDLAGLQARGVDAEVSLVQAVQAWFKCVLFHGFFHGDMHAGNLMLLDNEDIGFLDFGIVGRFTEHQRYLVTDYMIGFATGDFRMVAKVIADMGSMGPEVDLDEVGRDLEKVYGPLRNKSLGEVDYTEIMPRINEAARKHQMQMATEFVLITKQLLYFDRYAKLLAPNLNIFTDSRLIMSMMGDIMKVRQERNAGGPTGLTREPPAPS